MVAAFVVSNLFAARRNAALYLFLDKVMRLAGMIPVILVIATSDDFLVLDVGMSALRAIPTATVSTLDFAGKA